MKTLYQIVSLEGAELLTLDELRAKYPVKDREGPVQHLRAELRDQPQIEGLCGPMWGGYHTADGDSIFFEGDRPDGPRKSYSTKEPLDSIYIRYETWEAYDVYSR